LVLQIAINYEYAQLQMFVFIQQMLFGHLLYNKRFLKWLNMIFKYMVINVLTRSVLLDFKKQINNPP